MLNTRITAANWHEQEGKWKLQVEGPDGTFADECHILLNASGTLNRWQWPDISGLHSFSGTLLHTAAYDRSVSLEGKRVAVIGTGSSGIQVVAAISDQVANLGVVSSLHVVSVWPAERTVVSALAHVDSTAFQHQQRA